MQILKRQTPIASKQMKSWERGESDSKDHLIILTLVMKAFLKPQMVFVDLQKSALLAGRQMIRINMESV